MVVDVVLDSQILTGLLLYFIGLIAGVIIFKRGGF